MSSIRTRLAPLRNLFSGRPSAVIACAVVLAVLGFGAAGWLTWFSYDITAGLPDREEIRGLGDMAHGKEDSRFGQAVHHHVQHSRKIGERAAHSERKDNDAHVLDGRVSEQAFDVPAPVEHEACE